VIRQSPSAPTRLALTDGSYRTGENRVSWFASTFPSLSFYFRFVGIVLRASAKARRSEYDGHQWCLSSLDVLGALESVGVNFEITGLKHIEPLETPCIFVGNHMSMLETTILPALLWPFRDVTFVVKQSLIDYPIFKHVMRARDPVAVSQTNPRADLVAMMEGGVARLKHGTSMVVFPQGVRTPCFVPREFNTIGIKMARRAGVPILPVALKTDAWLNGKIVKDLGRIDPTKKVRFAFGEPMWIEGRGTEQHQETVRFIQQKLRSWEEEEESQ
jgi:1-acyl-sn-glycerol-3-phosphate acyltransferase